MYGRGIIFRWKFAFQNSLAYFLDGHDTASGNVLVHAKNTTWLTLQHIDMRLKASPAVVKQK